MRATYAAELGLNVNHGSARDVAIGSGKRVRTLDTVHSTFQFANEPSRHELEFHILPSCVHNVILGKTFLKATRTLSSVTKFARRVKKRLLEWINRRRLLFLGESAPKFTGFINGRAGDALADSGSSMLVMDEEYARNLGLHIHVGEEYRTRLLFADGSKAYTSGMTRGAVAIWIGR
ncbi:hypothetical protein K458DRAFT_462285 [Lentithecium fluviatile CBS 122367]|uniref:Peptidase A2 domain-containing protein n=1 Tax=Lentithecium fluviatile CBS 122367 TaxID=1168545 RepID=A0A6G1JGU4_9PLEO|nr:hypothetical protein K458DRAFT_462285 [Lentithecium fluviatile CBS 122367]